VKESFKTFALVMLDLFWFARNRRERVRRCLHIDPSWHFATEAIPAITITAHLGNWEMLGEQASVEDPRFVAVVAPLRNRGVDRLLNRVRQRGAQKVVYKEGAIRAAVKVLKDGGRIGLLLDQNILPREGGTFVDFFGVPVTMSTAAETLARRMKLPIVFCVCIPDGKGGYATGCAAVIRTTELPPDADITQQVARVMENQVRRTPEFWLWMYKRWRFIKPGDAAENYPYYSREIPRGEIGTEGPPEREDKA
jgi:lauroyl/myristoyl acyltransferase